MKNSLVCVLALLAVGFQTSLSAEGLPGTEPFAFRESTAEIVKRQLEQVRSYWQRRIAQAEKDRDARWSEACASGKNFERFAAAQRIKCRAMLGLDKTDPASRPAKVELLAANDRCRVERVEVPLPGGIAARGIVVAPTRAGRHASVIVCADAETWPEQWLGLADNAAAPRWLCELAGRDALVFIMQSVERLADHPYCQTTRGKDRRMILYRLGYPVGRTMPGLDVQDAIAAVNYLSKRADVDARRVGLLGIAQGGMTALYAAALDRRVRTVAVADYFDCRDRCWQEPVDRRLPGQLLGFGDAELAALVAPRKLLIVTKEAGADAAKRVAGEVGRARRFFESLKAADRLTLVEHVAPEQLSGRVSTLLGDALELSPSSAGTVCLPSVAPEKAEAARNTHFEERLAWLRSLIASSEARREARWRLRRMPASHFPKTHAAMMDDYRNLVGEVPVAKSPLRPRTELVETTDKHKTYRVLLDVTDGVEVYGNLLVPHGIRGRAPAVICQHGLSGTPEMITGFGQTKDTPYHEFGRRLAERGYVVFAPLILHYHPVEWTNDQARMADAVGAMRVAMAVAKTRRVVDFLQSLPFVDPQQIGYYGLSYGGYSALWIPPLEPRLKAVVVSGHFNDWRSKITSDATRTSYLLHPDEDFYNWNVLHRFTHVELVTLMAPRPVCIEYGRRDGITTPEWTAYAWKQLSAIRDHLGLQDRIVLAEFDGVHEVRGVESFEFLDRHLKASP